MSNHCKIPPSGWCCTRDAGHEGPCAAYKLSDPEGWASPILARAYFEIEKLRDSLAQPSESGIDEALKRALDAVEAADCELVGLAA